MIVYWGASSFHEQMYLGLHGPSPAFSDIKKLSEKLVQKNQWTDFTKCPSLIQYSNNLFALKSPIDLDFEWDGNTILFDYDQYPMDFISRIATERDSKAGMLSLGLCPYMFFSENDCEMQFSGATTVDNDFTKNCIVIPGQFNTGKWFRGIDFGFFIKDKNVKVSIKKGDTIANIRFLTDEKIVFKKFFITNQCNSLANLVVNYKHSQKFPLNRYLTSMYNDFQSSKLRNQILKEINNNLMD